MSRRLGIYAVPTGPAGRRIGFGFPEIPTPALAALKSSAESTDPELMQRHTPAAKRGFVLVDWLVLAVILLIFVALATLAVGPIV